jgi:hypothetical protein
MGTVIYFDTGLPTIFAADGRHVEVPAEVVAQADEELDLLEVCKRFAIKAGLAWQDTDEAQRALAR